MAIWPHYDGIVHIPLEVGWFKGSLVQCRVYKELHEQISNYRGKWGTNNPPRPFVQQRNYHMKRKWEVNADSKRCTVSGTNESFNNSYGIFQRNQCE